MKGDNSSVPIAGAQQGVGLLEVLIALLLLGVVALGYAALQGQSLKSTDESLTRTQAVYLIRGLAEKMRVNALQATITLKLTADANATTSKVDDVLTEYRTLLSSTTLPTAVTCNTANSGCTPNDIAKLDVLLAKNAAETYGIRLGASVCPGTQEQAKTTCLIAAWNDTNPVMGTGDNDCMRENGAYRIGADCVYMEAY